MIIPNQVRNQHMGRAESIQREVFLIYKTLVLPNWGGKLHGFPETLYGFVMVVLSRIDLLSSYWKGDSSSRGQTVRMVEFLDQFVFQATEANNLAIQIWRHKLMHTSEPRPLQNKKTGQSYRWLLHWGEHLPREQHFTFAETNDSKILNLGLIYLVEDLKEATQEYMSELAISGQLQQNYERIENELNSYKFSQVQVPRRYAPRDDTDR